jgi:NAD(P)-dependent dehydrogenase (short-subunit alcohol dehydrogenase family)
VNATKIESDHINLGEHMSETRRAIVVGGAGGIGSDICRRIASEGYRVVIADFNLDRAEALLGTLDGSGHEAVQLDITDEETVRAAFEAIEADAPASILVIASGGPVVHLGQRVNVATLTMSDWKRTLDLNLTGVFCCIQQFARLRLANPLEQSRIVIIGSSVGYLGSTPTDLAYVSSKAALFGLARQVAHELAPAGVTVNTVAPGPVETPEFMLHTNEQIRGAIASSTVLKRLATPSEISAGVSYLLSPAGAYLTGTSLDINGGLPMR